MKKWFVGLGLFLLGLIILYGSLAALVNQGLSLTGAVMMLIVIVAGGGALIYTLREPPKG